LSTSTGIGPVLSFDLSAMLTAITVTIIISARAAKTVIAPVMTRFPLLFFALRLLTSSASLLRCSAMRASARRRDSAAACSGVI
jgi:hypothetical protein